ncbi:MULTISPECIES: hypothetical protein [unclassified Streptomyces]|uniref:hypothetical protein n=1 Tax=unclassified Streptomyces TaxID=2593676 RepID=UPI0035DC2E58
MTFPDLWIVKARVQTGARIATAQVAVDGLKWKDLPVHGRQFAVRRARGLLYRQAGLCEFCTGLSIGEGPCIRPTACGPIRMSLSTGRDEYPLTDDMLTDYGTDPSRMLTLVATSRGHRVTPYSRLIVPAEVWQATHPEERQSKMRFVVEKLVRCSGWRGSRLDVQTLIWDGEREIPYPHNWAEALVDQGR